MLKKKHAAATLIAIFLASSQPTPVHASFFLFNIIQAIFSGGHKTTQNPTQAHPPGSTSTVIKFGMRSSQVASVQQYLIKAKYLGSNADGVFGYQTLRAVKAFQRDYGLLDDGIVGQKTMSVLKDSKATRPKVSRPPSQKPTYHPPQNANGIPNYLYTIPMLATAYTRYDEGSTDYTYRGSYLRKGLCAVDPNIISFGTKLYVPGYGEAIADDIGGAIQGNRIDLAMDTVDEAFGWGAQNVTVYVLPK
ncbi:MAG TPA: 3D domain-containing protein [Negativicutes bacterium]|jgi:3D (Asp-Asp-Asp) domain-containing protein